MDQSAPHPPFVPPRPASAVYKGVGRLALSDYWTYFRAMRRNPLEVWGEQHFSIRLAPFQFLGRSSLLVSDPDAIHHCFVSHASNYRMNRLRQAVLKPFLRDGLLTAEGETWKTVRHGVAPAFTPRRVDGFAPQILAICEQQTERLTSASGDTIQASDLFVDLTLDILMETLFSGDEALDKRRFTAGIHRLLELSGLPHPFDLANFPDWVPRVGQGQSRPIIEDLRQQVGKVARHRRAHPRPNGEAGPADFLDLLLATDLDETAIIDNLLTFLAAGHETTARSLTWTTYLLSQAPDVRDRLETEIDGAGLDNRPPAEWGDALPFTTAVIKESLRLYPSAPMLARTSVEADLVTGLPVPAGTDVLVSPWLLHRQRSLWPDADAFKPERFLGDAARDIPRGAYLPFGIGPRVCIGARFAMMEMVIVVATLYRRVRLDLTSDDHPRPVMRITLQPDRPVPMRVTRRAAQSSGN
ncbi:cytochrome P450 [Maricaulis sp. CAU 1757]